MAASHSSPPPKKPCVPPPNWLDLPADVSASILWRVGAVGILTSAQHVCSAWRRICRDPSMWRSIDISYATEPFLYTQHDLTELYHRAVDLSSGGLLEVNMEYASDGRLLRYIADRSKHLRRLRLVYCYAIAESSAMIEVARKFPFLEELDLSLCRFPSEVVAAFGRLCPRLKSFKLNDHGCKPSYFEHDDEAFAIAKNMPRLHHLQIFGNKLTDVGLIAILDGCRQLESLDLRQCFHVNLDAGLKRRCTEGIKHFRGPNDSTDDYPFDSEVYDTLSDDDDSYILSDVDFMSGNESGENYGFSGGSGDELDDEDEEVYDDYL